MTYIVRHEGFTTPSPACAEHFVLCAKVSERWRPWLLLVSILAWGIAFIPTPVHAESPVLLGLYPGGALQVEIPKLQAVDAWLAPTGKRFAIAGDFMDFEFVNPGWNVPAELNAAWNAGYVPFVNLVSGRTAAQIATGQIDGAIATWAGLFATWAGTGRRAFLAPLPEMNGNWIPYYSDPADFIAAYLHIREMFEAALRAKNVPDSAISWVFVPSGSSLAGDEFELFYPGHEHVDIVGFSSYNFGACQPPAPWVRWETFDTVFEPYLDRMNAMAPGKPIFITQTGVFDAPVHGVGDKDEWLRDSYTRLAAYPRLRGILYFNYAASQSMPNCDFRLHIPGTALWQGFKSAVADPSSNFDYWAPGSPEMSQIVFGRAEVQVFSDVFPVHPFAVDASEADFSAFIHSIYRSGVTAGCSTNPLRFCPAAAVSRAQMAVFLLRAMHGATYTPPAASGSVFADVPFTHPFGSWIEALATAGVTAGCGGGRYCPDQAVTRAQMAVFLLRGKYGIGYTPPPASGGVFADIPAGHPYARWIERLVAEGIAAGCGGGMFCPDAVVRRNQMAVFLVRAFNL